MSENTMLVRMPGGDVVRRPVAHAIQTRDLAGKPIGTPICEPELYEGEVLVRTLGDPTPKIIKTK